MNENQIIIEPYQVRLSIDLARLIKESKFKIGFPDRPLDEENNSILLQLEDCSVISSFVGAGKDYNENLQTKINIDKIRMSFAAAKALHEELEKCIRHTIDNKIAHDKEINNEIVRRN